jgi:tRNA G18 (ribose-2'-O)-methylase SpoU
VLRVHRLEHLDHPDLEPYRTLRQSSDHYHQRLFVAEGSKLVQRLLDSDLTLLSLLIPPEQWPILQPALTRRPESMDVYLAPKPLLETLVGFSMYQGYLACARIPEPAPLEVALALAPRPRFLVAADRLANAENLGGILRSAIALGAQALLLGETSAHPYLRRSVRASMGTVFKLPIVEPTRLADALLEVRRRGLRCVAAHPHADQRLLPHAQLQGDCCIVLGGEGEGLSPEVLEVCTDHVAIPMHHDVDSLNVGAAAAMFFYEVWRQRHAGHP